MSKRRKSHAARACVFLCLLLFLSALSSTAQNTAEDSAPQPSNLHQWGAVTLFHGLPSDRVRAIAQGPDGVMWFGTDAGLARYDGRRIQTVSDEGLASKRVRVLRFDEAGTLWVGTDGGAFVRRGEGRFELLAGTEGKAVRAVSNTERGRVLLATADGDVLECRKAEGDSFAVRTLAGRLTADAGKTQPLELTSILSAGGRVLVGTRGRGLMSIEDGGEDGGEGGEAKEVLSRPRAYFVEAIEQDKSGTIVFGAQTSGGDSGLFKIDDSGSIERPSKISEAATGTVSALSFDARRDLFVGTDGQGVYRYRGAHRLQHFTFAGTAGGLRSDHVFSIFIDREGVAWFGTDRGVCRYDPGGVRVETVSNEAEGNFVRVLYRTALGRLLCGTNRGLFVRDADSPTWRPIEELSDRVVYAVGEDSKGSLLVGSADGLHVEVEPKAGAGTSPLELKPEGKGAGEASAIVKGSEANEKGRTGERAAAAKTGEPAVTGSVRAIAVLDGATYIATYGRGVERLGDAPQQRTLVWPKAGADDARAREVISLHADRARGRLWIGTANSGLFYSDGREVRSEPALARLARSAVRGISGGSGEGEWLWIATSSGLYAYREGRGLVDIAPGIDARGVATIAPESQPRTGDETAAGATPTDATREAAARRVPQAWFSTAGSGVVKVALDEQFGALVTRLDAEQGLPSQNAFAVLPLAPQASDEPPLLLVGTTRGLARYEPGGAPPRLRLMRVTAARTHEPEELGADNALRLEYPQNGLVLDVAATGSRTFPEQFQYAFLLYDQKGRTVKQKLSHDSQFQIESLAPGSYRVEARAYNFDLVSSRPLRFEFEIAKAPFPRTIALLSVLLGLAVLALLWALAQHRRVVRSGAELLDANRQLAAARLQLANEAETERRRIARDLHDQTLADLRRLLLLTDEIQADAGAAAPSGGAGSDGTGAAAATAAVANASALRAEIESVSQEIRRICEDLSPSVLENVGFVAALEWALTERVAHLPADCKFTYDFVCDDEIEERLRLSRGVQMQIYRIVQEAVSNVCRHASAGRVRLSVEVSESDCLVLTLEDDGRGLPPENRKARHGRGLSNIRARASLIEAEVEWRKREEGGTIFVLRKEPERARADERAAP
jgi:signal transduction histidine kinase/ligand-binding sensor domain-containing protein